MTNMKLTKNGADILGGITGEGESRYWIGYYGLAYVPDREMDPLGEAAKQNKLVTSPYSDRIYNIWQGDMVNGYALANPEVGEDNAAASLFGLTLYDKSIRTNYRYVYDAENERNQLVAWKSINTGRGENTLSRIGAAVYSGGYRSETNGLASSELPIPAPLYYKGDPDVNQSISDMMETEDSTKISSDFRFYMGVERSGGYGWKAAEETYEGEKIYTPNNLLQSVSNFNKFHGTASSEGYGVSSVSSCHNMSKATKLFPINYYQVVNDNGSKLAETKHSENSQSNTPLATGIKFSIDLSPVAADTGYTALDYECGDDIEHKSQYESKYTSFRFNRIGIYAVKMTVHHYATDTRLGDCGMQKVQFEIDGDAEPILFAVADINDVIISDDPSSKEHGVAKFTLDFILNINGEDSQLERRTAVYYNLYENDATTWYKNQLLASASISEAVTDLSLEMNAIKQHISDKKECCGVGGPANTNTETNSYNGLKNLIDGVDKDGSVRGIDTFLEGDGSEIPPVSGASGNAPAGTLHSASVEKITGDVDGHSVTMPASYLYGLGFTDGTKDPSKITLEQLKLIVESKGVDWLHDNVVTDSGWYMSGHGGQSETEYLFVWTSGTTYAKISLDTSDITEYTVGASEENRYYTEVIAHPAIEDMFVDGYSIGKDSIVLGEDTACAGDYSIVQGRRVYVGNKAPLTAVFGSSQIAVDSNSDDNSGRLTVLNSSLLRIEDTYDSLIAGISDLWYTPASNISNVSRSVIGGLLPPHVKNVSDSIVWGFNHVSYGNTTDVYDGDIQHYVDRSLLLGPTLDYIYSDDEVAYRNAIGSPFPPEGLRSRFILSIGGNFGHPLSNSVVVGPDVMVSPFTVNSEDGDGQPRAQGYNNLIIGSGTRIGNGPHENVLVCSGSNIPNNAAASIMVGHCGDVNWNTDILISFDDFIAAFNAGTLQHEHYYAIIGDGVIPNWDTETETYLSAVLVDGHEGIFYGIYVDKNGHVIYTPYIYEKYRVGGHNIDYYMSTSVFRKQWEERTLATGYYALIGDGEVPVGYRDDEDCEWVPLENPIEGVYYAVNVYFYNGSLYSQYQNWVSVKTRAVGPAYLNRRNANDVSSLIMVGYGNYIGGDKRGTAVVGNGNDIYAPKANNLLVMGSGVTIKTPAAHLGRTYGLFSGSYTDILPSVSNLFIFGDGISLRLGGRSDYATGVYNNSAIFLNGDYNQYQEMYGIFDQPVNYSSFAGETDGSSLYKLNTGDYGTEFMLSPYAFTNYLDAAKTLTDDEHAELWFSEYQWYDNMVYPIAEEVQELSVPDMANKLGITPDKIADLHLYADQHESDDDVYRPNVSSFSKFCRYSSSDKYRDPFIGLTRRQIREMINKPTPPMVYTGGVCFAGSTVNSDGDNYGLIKLGHRYKPVAYIWAHDPSEWGAPSKLLQPASIVGTTTCPYGGMLLAIDNVQEVDGTMHLVLHRGYDKELKKLDNITTNFNDVVDVNTTPSLAPLLMTGVVYQVHDMTWTTDMSRVNTGDLGDVIICATNATIIIRSSDVLPVPTVTLDATNTTKKWLGHMVAINGGRRIIFTEISAMSDLN